ncbi:hypothetical protein EYF80_060618 [Liparis tanakae]|uniref:Uncharacterized protein n=1 Tax=Liparis tanakae TaxID=230148 RepID=A0A4Z2ELA5_9TELE|nr:hypothetical protein EYF80_060618 [Liparis tanakae]
MYRIITSIQKPGRGFHDRTGRPRTLSRDEDGRSEVRDGVPRNESFSRLLPIADHRAPFTHVNIPAFHVCAM